jgi:hypothetical protein
MASNQWDGHGIILACVWRSEEQAFHFFLWWIGKKAGRKRPLVGPGWI